MRFLMMLLWASVVCAQQFCQRDEADRNPFAWRPEAIEAGRKIFAGGCSACHGVHGEGGRGPNLVEARAVRRLSDRALFTSIQKGVPGCWPCKLGSVANRSSRGAIPVVLLPGGPR